MNYKTHKKAQILLITLLVLTVVAIAVSGTIILLNRDTQQSTSTQKYQQIYNVAENRLQTVIEKYGNSSESLENLSGDFATCLSTPEGDENVYTCNFEEQINDATTIDTQLRVIDSKEINNVSVQKDKSFNVLLNGYTGGIEVEWSSDFAMEFMVTYFIDADADSVWDSSERISNFGDVYDLNGVFDSRAAIDPNSTSAFNFSILNPENITNTTTFNISNITDFQADYYPLSLTIIPRSKLNPLSATNLTVRASDPSVFPFQMRLFESTGFDDEDASTPVVTVESKIPLSNQIDSLFDYSLITKDSITL